MTEKFASHHCLCGWGANSSSTLKRHFKNCEVWKSRDKDLVKLNRNKETLIKKYGSTNLLDIPYFKSKKKCLFCLKENCQSCSNISEDYENLEITHSKRSYFLFLNSVPYRNMDNKLTYMKYGYSYPNIKPISRKNVIAKCEFCDSTFETKMCNITNSVNGACKKCDALSSSYKDQTVSKSQFHKDFIERTKPKLNPNLLAKETLEKFGYDVESLNFKTAKKVCALCDYCKSQFDLSFSKYTEKYEDLCCNKKECKRAKTVKTLERKYGVKCTLSIPGSSNKIPSTEKIVMGLLENRYKVNYHHNYNIGPYSFDFFLPDHNLLIECQGDYFHNFKEYGYFGNPRDRSKSSYVENNTNHKLLWIYEHEIHLGKLSKILDNKLYHKESESFDFELKNIEFKKCPNHEAHEFLSLYHYLGNLGSVVTCYGGYLDGKLVVLSAFSGVGRNQTIKSINDKTGSKFGPKDIRELRRFCVHPSYHLKNLSSFSLRKFLKLLKINNKEIKAVVSYSDPNVGDNGTIYLASNWTKLGESPPSYHYLDVENNRIINKKTVWDMAKNSHMSENDFYKDAGLVRVEENLKKVRWLKTM